MGKMIWLCFIQILFLFPSCHSRGICQKMTNYYNQISVSTQLDMHKCWTIVVPENSYVRLNINTNFENKQCSSTYIQVNAEEVFKFCNRNELGKQILALSDVTITFFNKYSSYYSSSFDFHYTIENVMCAQKSHFRCLRHQCINKNKVCDGVKNCENGVDEIGCEKGISAVTGVNASRENAVSWLRKELSASFGWGKNTHRAITALYLSGNATFLGHNLEEELIAKQLELQTSVALLRNSSDSLTVNDLSMFINALSVTCHNPRQFYGYDLLKILSGTLATSTSVNPGAYLTLCNANWTFSENQTLNLLNILQKESDYLFHLDVQAMTMLALSCIKSKNHDFDTIQNATEIYDAMIEQIISNQLPDGSFGNVYTTALVTQALIANGQENNKLWKVNSTIKFIMKELNSSSDFLSVYFSLPVFNGKSLLDIGRVNCTNHRKHDKEISDIKYKLGGKMSVQYSLFVGDLKDVIHTIYLRVPENSSAYDIMKIAEVVDAKYKFSHQSISGKMYVYEIAGITNDPEAGKFWLLYTGGLHINNSTKHHTKSPDKFIVHDEENLIMWYKSAEF